MHPPQTVCHRGANEYAPENTYASAQLCVEWGVDYLEIDVNRSSDGVFYLFHGPGLERTTDGRGNLGELPSAEIDRLDAGSWFAPQFGNERVPRLEPFLTWLDGRCKLFIDVKAGTPEQHVEYIYRHGLEESCFFWCGLESWMLRLREIDTQLALKVNVRSAEGVVDAHERFGANIVEVGLENMSDALVQRCRDLGIKIMVYVQEKDVHAYRQVLEWGADMINLNHADLFAQVACEYRQSQERNRA